MTKSRYLPHQVVAKFFTLQIIEEFLCDTASHFWCLLRHCSFFIVLCDVWIQKLSIWIEHTILRWSQITKWNENELRRVEKTSNVKSDVFNSTFNSRLISYLAVLWLCSVPVMAICACVCDNLRVFVWGNYLKQNSKFKQILNKNVDEQFPDNAKEIM